MATSKHSAKPASKNARSKQSTVRRPSKKPQVISFTLTKPDKPFLSVSPSVETLYWFILGLVVIAFSLWILKLQADIDEIYNSIDQNNQATIELRTSE